VDHSESAADGKWQEQRAAGELKALKPRKRGRKAKPQPDPEVARLRKQVARLERELARAEKVIEVQKEISEILGVEQNLPDELKNEES
jgi:transposase